MNAAICMEGKKTSMFRNASTSPGIVVRNLTVGATGEECGWAVGVEERCILALYILKVPFEFSFF